MEDGLATYTEKERAEAAQSILKRREYKRLYYQKRKVNRPEYYRQHYREHQEEIIEHGRLYRQEHKEECVEKHRLYLRDHPEVGKASNHKHRTRRKDSNGSFTSEAFRLLCETYNNRCVYCHKELPLTPDHKVPLSRGGSNDIGNIVPACRSCNSRKFMMTYDEYVERLKVCSDL